MGVDTVARLKGNVSPEAVKNALERMGCTHVDISGVTAQNWGPCPDTAYACYDRENQDRLFDGFIRFSYRGTARSIFYFWNSVNILENLKYYEKYNLEDMVRSETTRLSMRKCEDKAAIMLTLVKELGGGWFDEDDCDNKPYIWVTPSDAGALLEALGNPPEPKGTDMEPVELSEAPSGISAEAIKKAEQVLIDNGIEADEAATILQAVGYALLGKELYKP